MGARDHEPRRGLRRKLSWAIAIAATATLLEVLGSWLSGSLALLSDAGHVGTDAVALGLSLWALRVAEKPHTPKHSYGYHRTEVLASLANGGAMLAVSAVLVFQAYRRFSNPPPIEGGTMFLLGFAGLVANVAMLFLLRDSRSNINIRGAFLHVYGDTLGSAGVIAAAILIRLTGFLVVDVIVAAFIVGLILISAGRLLRDCVHILLEASPAHVRPEEVAAAIRAVPEVRDVHDLHIWTITSGLCALTAHLSVAGTNTVLDASRIVDRVRACLRERFGITHVTLQVEGGGEAARVPAGVLGVCGCQDVDGRPSGRA